MTRVVFSWVVAAIGVVVVVGCDGGRETGPSGALIPVEQGPVDPRLKAACRDEPARCPVYRVALEAACARGDAQGCGRLASLLAAGIGGARDEARARRLATDACAAGSSFGCTNLAAFAMRGSGGPRDLQEAYRAAAASCRLHDETGCSNLSDVLHKDGLVIEPAERTAALQLACDHYAPQACETLVNELIELARQRRLGQDAHPVLRASVLRLCQLGSASACSYLVDLVRGGVGGPNDDALAARAARRACDLGERPRCGHGDRPRLDPGRAWARILSASDGGDHLDRLGALEVAWSPCAEVAGDSRHVHVEITIAPGAVPHLRADGPTQLADCFVARFPWRERAPDGAHEPTRLDIKFELARPH